GAARSSAALSSRMPPVMRPFPQGLSDSSTRGCSMFKFVAAILPLMLLLAPRAWAQDDAQWLDIEVGKSVVLETPRNVSAIAITNPAVADVVPLATANKLQVQGKS